MGWVSGVVEPISRKRVNLPENLIGRRLRRARRERKLSLRSLAAKIGVTGSLLSQIETGQVNPSVDTLYAMAEGLGVPTCYFFEEAEEHSQHAEAGWSSEDELIVRPGNRRSLRLAHGVIWESLLPAEEPRFEWCEVHYPAGSISAETMERHGGRHYLMVVEGRLTVQLAFTVHEMNPGDSMAFDASTPHQLRNEGSGVVRALVALLQQHEAGAPGPGYSGMLPDRPGG